jgi:hypothetical protein
MKEVKYSDLLDYILMVSKIIRDNNPTKYLSLKSVIRLFKKNISFNEVIEIGKYLEARGWAKAVYVLGDVRLQILTSGIVYLEDKGKEFEDQYLAFIKDVQIETEEGDFFVRMTDENEDPKETIIKMLDNVSAKVKEKAGDKVDFIQDIEIIKTELTKLNPDFRLIEIKLNNLSSISYIMSEVQELKDYLTPIISA